jgi:hypothetical protein
VGGFGGAIYCYYSSPTITGNSFLGNGASSGGAIALSDNCSPLISGNTISGHDVWGEGGAIVVGVTNQAVISDNLIFGNSAGMGGGAICSYWYSTPLISNNIFIGNSSTVGGAIMNCLASAVITNNLLCGNEADEGGAIHSMSSDELIVNNTMAGNSAAKGGAVFCSSLASPTIVNCILWNNTASNGKEVYLEHGLYTSSLAVSFTDLEGGQSSVHVDPECTLDWGEGMIDEDPLFTEGPLGDCYLSQTAAGQGADSPGLDSGDPDSEMIWGVTRTDHVHDTTVVDMGFHYPWQSVSSQLVCTPASGTLPFPVKFGVWLSNNFIESSRRIGARIDADLAGGLRIPSWKAGTVTIEPNDHFISAFIRAIPMLPQVVGENTFTLVAEDVTPAPYNQPPYPPSGDTDQAGCTVTGIVP